MGTLNLILKPPLRLLLVHHQRCFLHSETPLQISIRTAIYSNNYHDIPQLLLSHSSSFNPNPNPFSFITSLPPTLTARIIDDILQSLIPLRPRSLSHPLFSSLLSLSLTLPNPNPSFFLPLSLTILQSSIRSGFPIPPQTRLSLSLSYLHLLHHHNQSPSQILSSVRLLGYSPDLNTCNFLITSLAASSDPEEAIAVLRGMPRAGLLPDSESYCSAIESAIGDSAAEGLIREMVGLMGMVPRKGTVGRVVRGMVDVRRAAELVRFLDREGCKVGFESYEAVVERCLKKGEFVLAGRVVVEMVARGFVPYIGARQKVVEGLAGIGQCELASAVRQRLAEIGS